MLHTLIKGVMFMLVVHLTSIFSCAQNSDSVRQEKKIQIRGYVKNMQSFTFNGTFDSLITGNLIHNRLNVRWQPGPRVTGAVEFRNRLFWGEEVRVSPDFPSGIKYGNEFVDASIVWFDTPGMVFQTDIDRFWLEYHSNTLAIRLGRQRINWGISTIWNPNDIFNTYNFLDFDYEERPGRDAVKIQYQFSGMSNLEVSAAFADDHFKESVAAVRYFTNKWNYDFQFSSGVYKERITLGTGWSGSIGEWGFKGEMQYFAPVDKDTSAVFNMTMETDYIGGKGWYVNGGFLFNSIGITGTIENWSLAEFQLSPEQLMPTRWNTMFSISKQISPLFTGTITAIYAPGTNLLIVLPTFNYNLATNLDVDIIWQSFYAEQPAGFDPITYRGYLRLKWSF